MFGLGSACFVDFVLATIVAGATETVAATVKCDCSPVAVMVAFPACVSETCVENVPSDAATICAAEAVRPTLCRGVNAADCATGPPDPSAWLAGAYVTEMSTPSPPWNPCPVTVTEPPTLTLPDETVSSGLCAG
jgi:hypothetical protein